LDVPPPIDLRNLNFLPEFIVDFLSNDGEARVEDETGYE
jgi:hypothetical protein